MLRRAFSQSVISRREQELTKTGYHKHCRFILLAEYIFRCACVAILIFHL